MKRIVLAVFMALVAFSSCRKQEPVDYSGPLTLFRVGDPSYKNEAGEYHLHSYSNQSYDVIGWFDSGSRLEAFTFCVCWTSPGNLAKGMVMTMTEGWIGNSFNLGYSKTIEGGRIVYLGEQDGEALFRFEDVAFKVVRPDESEITDTYQIRGIAKSKKQ